MTTRFPLTPELKELRDQMHAFISAAENGDTLPPEFGTAVERMAEMGAQHGLDVLRRFGDEPDKESVNILENDMYMFLMSIMQSYIPSYMIDLLGAQPIHQIVCIMVGLLIANGTVTVNEPVADVEDGAEEDLHPPTNQSYEG